MWSLKKQGTVDRLQRSVLIGLTFWVSPFSTKRFAVRAFQFTRMGVEPIVTGISKSPLGR